MSLRLKQARKGPLQLTRSVYLGPRVDDKLGLERPFENSREFRMIQEAYVYTVARLARDPKGEVLASAARRYTRCCRVKEGLHCNLRSILQNVNSSSQQPRHPSKIRFGEMRRTQGPSHFRRRQREISAPKVSP